MAQALEHADLFRDFLAQELLDVLVQGDGQVELYVASDDQREVRMYTYDRAAKTWSKEVIGALDESTITWNVTATSL